MSAREWKPGDVAMTAKNTVALCHNGGRMIDQGGAPWSDERFPDNLRPLVVIDPEDREQVERLVDALDRLITSGDDYADGVQAALREFANPTPPKPDEPTGLGAVVEDTNYTRWTRVEAGDAEARNPWYPAHDPAMQPAEWAEISVVRVLSEGVQA